MAQCETQEQGSQDEVSRLLRKVTREGLDLATQAVLEGAMRVAIDVTHECGTPEGTDAAVLDTFRSAFTALTALPEDVARDVEAVDAGLNNTARCTCDGVANDAPCRSCDPMLAARSSWPKVKAAAARVETLRKRVAFLQGLLDAEKAERDALREKVGALEARRWVQCTSVSNDCLGGCRTMQEHDRYRQRHIMVEMEEKMADAAMAHAHETAGLRHEAEALRERLGLPAPAAKVWRDLLAAVQRLPKPSGHSGDEEAGEHDEDCELCQWEALQAMAEEANFAPTPAPDWQARATAAEAKVQELEETANRAGHLLAVGSFEVAARVLEQVLGKTITVGAEPIPTPAPSQRCPGCGRTWTRPTRCGDCDRNTVTAPTPAPGLREAVGPLAVALREANSLPRTTYPSDVEFDWNIRLPSREWKAILSALDATPPAVTHAQLAGLVNEYVRETLRGIEAIDEKDPVAAATIRGSTYGAHHVLRLATGGQTPREAHPTAAHAKSVVTRLEEMLSVMDDGTLGKRDVVGRVQCLLETSAKWDAAVERVRDGETLRRVAGAAFIGVSEWDADVESDVRERGASDELRSVAAAVARHVLGLTLPKVPGGGETWCGCEASKVDDSGHCEQHGGEPAPEDACGDCGRHVDEHRDGGASESCEARNDLEPTPRARIAPTPTPEGPALAQPEPASPEVVATLLLGDLTVYSDGTWKCDADEPLSSVSPDLVDALARAVAEAIRERGEYADLAGRTLEKAVQEAARLTAEAQRQACANAVLAGPAGVEESRGDVFVRVAAVPLVTG